MTFTAGNRDLATIAKVGGKLAGEIVGQSLQPVAQAIASAGA